MNSIYETSRTGTVFDIKQLAVFDGPGIRTTVFLKGCPLRCRWCHNPEGLSYKPQLMVSDNGCLQCGKCREVCEHPEGCVNCGRCVRACPKHLRKICGTEYTAEELAKKLLKDKRVLEMNGGGITISGGEPTGQPAFLIELLTRTSELHRAIETCGYCSPDIFAKVLEQLDYIIMDIKLVDPELHRTWTGRDNTMILANLEQVKASGKPFRIRIPLIPGVTDTTENKEAVAKLLQGAEHLDILELLPYHQTAGAKYGMVAMEYDPGFQTDRPVDTDISMIEKYGVPVAVL